MANEVILCSSCGITLRPFMRLCPRCGAVRENATPIASPTSAELTRSVSPPSNFLKAATGSAGSTGPTGSTGSKGATRSIRSTEATRSTGSTESTGSKAATESTGLKAATELTEVERARADSLDPDGEQKTEVIPFDLVRLQKSTQQDEIFLPIQDLVFLSPNEPEPRFPLFTYAQKTLIAIGLGLLILMLVIAYLLWRQQQGDQSKNIGAEAASTHTAPVANLLSQTSPTPTPPGDVPGYVDDASITESVKMALMAYSPLGFNRYKFEVKEGIVTVNGEAEHQPEKDGVDNVVRLVAGVKAVVNNLKIRVEQPALDPSLSVPPVKLNTAEAKVLEEGMRRQVEQAQQMANREPAIAREVREQAAAKQREKETLLKKAAEERLRRETEDFERRQEELRRTEAERRARAEQARLEASALRSGTIAWSALVEGIDEIIITGSSASVRHVSGAPPRDVKISFSAPVPRSPVNVKMIAANGRGAITIVQEPSAANGYTIIVRVDDSEKNGDKLYQFTLRWTVH